ncbi:MAG TPA: WD40 repeat domain-containing protein, partial [Acidimicrobiia bacterium]|nr:WD40 repeat domain-containing protein [Acidimicrobiia bacterium]
MHAAGLDVGEATGRIAAAVSRIAEDPNLLIAQVRQRARPLVVVLDALDEAVTPAEARAIASKLLVALARDAADVGVKVLVGTRPGPDAMFLRALGGRARVIDLDDPRYFEIADLAQYAARSLRLEFDLSAASPYCDDAPATAVVAQAIAEAAFPSFLVAGLTARARAEDEAVIDTTLSGWQGKAAFPADVDMAMADYLDRLGDPGRAFDLLVPVAYARYPGLPRDTLWAPLAEAYAGKPCGPADVDWLLATAASFLLEETDDAGTGVVRLFHQALVDHVRSRTQPSVVEQAITGVLTRRAGEAGGWLHAERYARLHAASHAAAGGGELLDRLVADPAFLVAADRRGLLRVLPRLTDPEAQRAADCYRAAAARLSGDDAADAAYLELASRIERNDELADAIRGLGLPQPFSTTFGRRRPTDDPLPPVGHTGGVKALAWGTLEGSPVLASSGDDATIRLWDPADGTQRRVLEGHTGWVRALTWGSLGGAPVLASAGFDATIRLWDPARGVQLGLLEGHTAAVRDVAWGALDGTPVVASAGADGTVRLWDPADGTQLRLLEGHTAGVRAVAWGSLAGTPVLASGGADGTVRLWDPADGTLLRVLEGDTAGVRVVAWGSLADTSLLASAGDDGTVRLWDPADGTLLRVLEG